MIDYFFSGLRPVVYWSVGSWLLVTLVVIALVLVLALGKLATNDRSIHVFEAALSAIKVSVAVAGGLFILTLWVGCFITLPVAMGHSLLTTLGPS